MFVEGGGKYSVRLIPQTCSREDAIKEIVGALDHLNAISDEIFSTVRTRLSSHRQQVESLSTRVSAASTQISALKGSQKAIRIVSAAKYPCEKDGNGSSSVFEYAVFPALVAKHVPDRPVLGYDVEESEDDKCRRPFRFDTPIKHPNDLLSIFHVKEPNLGDLSQLDNTSDVGLGKPPSTLRNMDSFFLFNTVDNPYVNYKMTERSMQDRNFGTLKPARKGEEVYADSYLAVPQENDIRSEHKTDADDFYYNPSALEIPNIDVPEFLPDLPGIAENLDLSDEFLSPIFPCHPKSLSFSNPPLQFSSAIEQKTPQINSVSEKNGFFAMHTSTPVEVPTSFSTRPSPSSVDSSTSATSKGVITAGAPPPPPPPPPPVVLEPAKSESSKAPKASTMGGGDVRSSLMAAIREAGGSGKASLKSAKDKKYEAKKKKQDEKEKSLSNELKEGGDMMADLKNTLAMRRRGISGIQDGQKRADVGDLMQTLAATIPTIESSAESTSGPPGGSDDDDWD